MDPETTVRDNIVCYKAQAMRLYKRLIEDQAELLRASAADQKEACAKLVESLPTARLPSNAVKTCTMIAESIRECGTIYD
jgi:hypothetical protein